MSPISRVTWRIILLCLLSVVDAFNLFGSDCPDDTWKKFEGKCYLFTPRFSYLAKAKTFCEIDHEAHLVSISSLAENNYLTQEAVSLCESTDCPKRHVWLGLTPGSQGTWLWTDGTKYGWSRWRDGVPFNPPRGQDCVALNVDAGAWTTESCSEPLITVCTKAIASKMIWYIGLGVGGGVVLLIIIICCCCCCCCGKRKKGCQGDNLSDIWSDDSSYGPTPSVKKQAEMNKGDRFGMSKAKRTPSTCSRSGTSKHETPGVHRTGQAPPYTTAIEMTPLTSDNEATPATNPYVDSESHKPVLQRVHSIEHRL